MLFARMFWQDTRLIYLQLFEPPFSSALSLDEIDFYATDGNSARRKPIPAGNDVFDTKTNDGIRKQERNQKMHSIQRVRRRAGKYSSEEELRVKR